MNWQAMDSCPKDGSMVMLFIPGSCPITKDVVIGGWNVPRQLWELLPYGTVQPVTLYPSRWAPMPAGPNG